MSDERLPNQQLIEMMAEMYTPMMRQTQLSYMKWAGLDQDRIDAVIKSWAEWDALPDEEKHRRRKQHEEEAEAARASRHEYNKARHEQVVAEANHAHHVLGEVAGMHKPERQYRDYDECNACKQEVSGYEYDMDEWPCATFTTIEKGLGLA